MTSKQYLTDQHGLMTASAMAHANIALVKYWGKRHQGLNLPAVGSLSVTLSALTTRTTVTFDPALTTDQLHLNGAAVADVSRLTKVLDKVRSRAQMDLLAYVESHNNFPTGAGLASSASGFAALTLAATHAANLELSKPELTRWARLGSGSAARSIYGGFVRMHVGQADDGQDCFASRLSPASHWSLKIMVVVTATQAKSVSSGLGMTHADTSPFFSAWCEHQDADLQAMERAIATRDFELLARTTERSCHKMHALMLSSEPSLLYWNAATVDVMHRIRQLRAAGVAACYTIDAGPQVKVICTDASVDQLRTELSRVPGVVKIIESDLGQDAKVVSSVAST